jgi:hypothetical protein
MFKVKIANNCEREFINSHIALKRKSDGNINSFTALYHKEYNIVLSSGYLTFKSEADYTWFVLRWS